MASTHFLRRNLKQDVMYWPPPTLDGFTEPTFTDPVQLTGRWEDKQEQFLDREGEEKVSHAIVYLSQDVSLGGFLWLGVLEDLSSSEEFDPRLLSGAFEIKQFTKIPDIKARHFERKVWLCQL